MANSPLRPGGQRCVLPAGVPHLLRSARLSDVAETRVTRLSGAHRRALQQQLGVFTLGDLRDMDPRTVAEALDVDTLRELSFVVRGQDMLPVERFEPPAVSLGGV